MKKIKNTGTRVRMQLSDLSFSRFPPAGGRKYMLYFHAASTTTSALRVPTSKEVLHGQGIAIVPTPFSIRALLDDTRLHP